MAFRKCTKHLGSLKSAVKHKIRKAIKLFLFFSLIWFLLSNFIISIIILCCAFVGDSFDSSPSSSVTEISSSGSRSGRLHASNTLYFFSSMDSTSESVTRPSRENPKRWERVMAVEKGGRASPFS